MLLYWTEKALQVLLVLYIIQIIRTFNKIISNLAHSTEHNAQVTLKQKNVVIVFGSGGHTTEMLMMIGKGNIFERYGHIYFVIGQSDKWSENKIRDFFQTQCNTNLNTIKNLTFIRVFRAREVKQSYITSVFTTIFAIVHSFFILAKLNIFSQVDLVLTNGPGTAIPICYSNFVLSKLLLFNL